VLPAILPFALLTAISLYKALSAPKVPVPSGFAVLALTPVLVVATLSGAIYLEHARFLPNNFALVSAIIALVTGTACLVFALSRQKVLLLVSGVICVVAFVEATDIWALPAVDTFFSPRRVAQIVREYPQSAGTITTFRLKRGWQYGSNFYLRRELQEWNGDLGQPVLTLVSPDGLRDLRVRRIPFTILDRTCLDAMLVEIGRDEKKANNQQH
jgi:hypothetical protein